MNDVQLYLGDCLEVMAGMEPDGIDSIVTDPPYGLSFMGKAWDHGVPGIPFWEMALRVAKPGAHLLAFGGTRTSHRLAVAIEDAGWEIRDTIMWVYGSGFPKSLDVSKAIDKAAGVEDVIGTKPDRWTGKGNALNFSTDRPQAECKVTVPATDEAKDWAGWGTALKPAWEPIIVARKPLRGTVAANVLEWGTGGINVDGCRIESGADYTGQSGNTQGGNHRHDVGLNGKTRHTQFVAAAAGRWPANVVHDGSDEVVGLFPVSTSNGGTKPNPTSIGGNGIYGGGKEQAYFHFGDTGSAARFFYCAKASRADRDEGLEGLPEWTPGERTNRKDGSDGLKSPRAGAGRPASAGNHHPTVKPTDLMRWLVRLVTRPGGVVLDPFMGSGSTGKAAALEGLRFVGIEQDGEYLEIARRRIEAVRLPLFAAVDE